MDRKRAETMEKEQQRWERMAADAAAETARLEAVRASGLRGRQNKSSEHFNIITLDYHNTPEGQSLQFKVCVCGCCQRTDVGHKQGWGGGHMR